MNRVPRAGRVVGLALALLIASTASALAAPLSLDYDFGVIDLSCASEGAACAQDVLSGGTPSAVGNVFTNIFNGGYRAGGSVVWDFTFDDSPFFSISSMTMQIDVIGLLSTFVGNIGPGGQLGNFFAIDGVPFAPLQFNTDGRDSYSFVIPVLSAGPHQFSVQVYDPAFSPGGNYEGWGGVDFARLTVQGETGAEPIPEPASLLLVAAGLAGVRRGRSMRAH